MHHFLALCARIEGDGAYYRQFAQEANELADWAKLPAQAEAHGLGPLLYAHLRAAGVQLPPPIKQALQGLYLRHRHANRVRARVLAEILTAYRSAGIQTLVLKGAALAHLIYPEPGLRPMSDLDLLVKKSQAHQAQGLLSELGFHAHLPDAHDLPNKHLLAAVRRTEGLLVSVEIHHNLFDERHPASIGVESLTVAPLSFSLEGLMAHTLGYEDMLWHLCQHIAFHTTVWQPCRFIWIADIVGFAGRFAGQIDWGYVAKQYPLVLDALSLFHSVTPLSETLLQQAPIKTGRKPQGIGLDFQGWPRSSIARQRAKGYWRIVCDTFLPPEWWLRLRYGLGSDHPLFWYRWVRHPLHILGWVKQLLMERIGRRIPLSP